MVWDTHEAQTSLDVWHDPIKTRYGFLVKFSDSCYQFQEINAAYEELIWLKGEKCQQIFWCDDNKWDLLRKQTAVYTYFWIKFCPQCPTVDPSVEKR